MGFPVLEKVQSNHAQVLQQSETPTAGARQMEPPDMEPPDS